MTVVEKAAYLKGLVSGLGVDPESRDGKLWNALTELVSDMAHEIEDLQAENAELSEALDDVFVDLTALEEMNLPQEAVEDEEYDDDFEESDDLGNVYDLGTYNRDEEDAEDAEDAEDEELQYDGVMYDVTCPACGEEITFDEATLEEGSIRCPSCGETLEFDLGDSED